MPMHGCISHHCTRGRRGVRVLSRIRNTRSLIPASKPLHCIPKFLRSDVNNRGRFQIDYHWRTAASPSWKWQLLFDDLCRTSAHRKKRRPWTLHLLSCLGAHLMILISKLNESIKHTYLYWLQLRRNKKNTKQRKSIYLACF